MPVDARLLLRDPAIPVPIYEVDVSVCVLPEPGDNWWRETFAATVTSVEEDVPRITIERNVETTRALYDGLPDGAEIGANCDSRTGIWEVHVQHPGGQILGLARGHDAEDDVLDIAARARADAMSE